MIYTLFRPRETSPDKKNARQRRQWQRYSQRMISKRAVERQRQYGRAIRDRDGVTVGARRSPGIGVWHTLLLVLILPALIIALLLNGGIVGGVVVVLILVPCWLDLILRAVDV